MRNVRSTRNSKFFNVILDVMKDTCGRTTRLYDVHRYMEVIQINKLLIFENNEHKNLKMWNNVLESQQESK